MIGFVSDKNDQSDILGQKLSSEINTTHSRAQQGPQTQAKFDPFTIVRPPSMIRSIMLADYYLIVFDGEHNLNMGPTET